MKRFFILTMVLVYTLSPSFAQHQFNEVTSSFGITGQDGLGHAVGWGDINDDGLMDLAYSNQGGDGIWLYKNNGSGFTDIAYSAGISSYSANKIMFADLNDDYYPEIIIQTRSGAAEIFRNNGNETFSNMSTGVSGEIYAVDDFNNDGKLDIVSFTSSGLTVFTNDGDMTFTSHLVTSANNTMYTALTCLDYNNDTHTDIYYTEDAAAQETHLLKNNGDLTFTDVTVAAGASYTGHCTAVTAGDYNNDGNTDLYIESYETAGARLLKNNGNETFSNVSSAAGTDGNSDPRTTSFTDYNNDGLLDIFTSYHETYNWSNVLYRNNSGTTFTDVAYSMGVADPGNFSNLLGDYFSVAWADFDNDGDMDFFSAGHIDKYNLYRNDNNPSNGFVLNLKGVESNNSAIGTKAVLWIDDEPVYRTVTGGHGARDFNSTRLHFGIGSDTSIDSLVLYWKSGIVQTLLNSNIVMNGVTTIFESGEALLTPTANFGCSSTSIVETESVTFTDNSLEGGAAITLWEWTFTGGTPSSYSGETPSVITYNTAGTYEVSLTVTNTHGSDTETKTGYITVLPMGDAFSLDFELPENYSQVFSPWGNIDNDGKTTYTSSDCDFPGEGSAFSFMAFNPSDAGFSLASTHGGDRCGMAICPGDATASDNWIISDKLTLGTGAEFKFWALTPKPGTWGNETFNVLISTSTNDLTSFTAIASSVEAEDSWTQETYDLSSYVGQDVYVAIQHISADKFMFWVDDIEVTGGVTSNNTVIDNDISIYPNPATDAITITNISNSKIEISDIRGTVVLSEYASSNIMKVDLSEFEEGTYIVRIINENSISIKKIILK